MLPLRGRTIRHVILLTLASASVCAAQNLVRIDATAPPPAVAPVPAQLGSNRSPSGEVILANSQYLTLNGKPWLPVMGEFHYSRYPQAEWEEEILKMKAAGVGIISTYVIWIHQEQKEGIFDWSGQRDLRAFVQLCAKHGMYVYPRIGPWAHAEVRNGGLPDWVMKASPVRQNDPVYLSEVATFYKQVALQLRGLLWKDGGPVIGLQIENEYRDTGEGKGAEHIRTLKKMAVDDGLDVPLYTVTGWDGAAIPLDAALPVFGGYPDAPWDGSPKQLPPTELYAFRFANRSAGSMGAIGGGGQSGADTYRGTPFLTAEVGSGIQDTYFRRPVVSGDDIAAIAPVMLGSGVNLLGYYMFHGGRNPDGGDVTLQESQRTGYPTDVPVKNYDFQAPLGEFGQERPSLKKLKLVHYFLEDFGSQLAPMTPHAPITLPKNPADLSTPRVSARTLGDSGYIFFNNHIRGASPAAFQSFQVELRLPGGVVRIPEIPTALASGSYGIWPVNIPLGSTLLHYSTAQLVKRVPADNETLFVFFAIPGIKPELMLPADTKLLQVSADIDQQRSANGLRLRMSGDVVSTVRLASGEIFTVLPEADAEKLWRGDDASVLVSTTADAFSDGSHWTFQSTGDPKFAVGVVGPHVALQSADAPLGQVRSSGFFEMYDAQLPAVSLPIKVVANQLAQPRKAFVMGPALSWRKNPVPLAPEEKDFDGASVWKLSIPSLSFSPYLADVILRVRYEGDVARLYSRDKVLDDNFWNGEPWEIGMREVADDRRGEAALQLHILPLPNSYPMYLERASTLHFERGMAAALSSVELIPRYQLKVDISSAQSHATQTNATTK